MTSNLCCITGKSISEGAVSIKTGHIYQKQVILKHLSSFPYCPITNQDMSNQDLIFIENSTANKIYRPQQSISSYLSNLKSQYDVLVLETFYIRKNLTQTKEQLAHSLTANQAAQKVIAKLIKQNQVADKQLQKMEVQLMNLKSK